MARGRKKKSETPAVTIPARIQQIVKEVQQKEDLEFKQELDNLIETKYHSEWDVRIGERIEFLILLSPMNLQDINLSIKLVDWILNGSGLQKPEMDS